MTGQVGLRVPLWHSSHCWGSHMEPGRGCAMGGRRPVLAEICHGRAVWLWGGHFPSLGCYLISQVALASVKMPNSWALTPCTGTSVDFSQYNLREQERCGGKGPLRRKKGTEGKVVIHSKDVTHLGHLPTLLPAGPFFVLPPCSPPPISSSTEATSHRQQRPS